MPTSPFAEALAKVRSRTVRAADLSSDEWSQLPTALRERAFFSARTTNAAYLQEVKTRIEKMLDPQTVTRDGRPVTEGLDLATARLELKGILDSIGYNPDPKDAGTIKDLSSDNRLNLLLRHNVQSAQGYGWHKQGQDPDLLDQWPAQELFRAEDRNEPRDWQLRWNNARGELGDATSAIDGRIRMVALKNDPIWTAISAFGTPYSPFDFNSGMDVRDIARAEAEALGIIGPDASVEPDLSTLNDNLEASIQGLDREFVSRLRKEFGDQVKITNDAIRWLGTPKEETRLVEEKLLARRRSTEKMVVFDSNGKVLIDRDGEESSVSVYSSDAPLLRDSIVTHNHPGGRSFSFDDLAVSVSKNVAEIRAVGVAQPYTYSLKRPEKGWPQSLPLDYAEISRDVYRKFQADINAGRMTIQSADASHAHQVMKRLASKHNLQYERTKRP